MVSGDTAEQGEDAMQLWPPQAIMDAHARGADARARTGRGGWSAPLPACSRPVFLFVSLNLVLFTLKN